MKFWQKQKCTVFLRHGVNSSYVCREAQRSRRDSFVQRMTPLRQLYRRHTTAVSCQSVGPWEQLAQQSVCTVQTTGDAEDERHNDVTGDAVADAARPEDVGVVDCWQVSLAML